MVERRELFIDNLYKNVENIFKSKLNRNKNTLNINVINASHSDNLHNSNITNSISNLRNFNKFIGKSNPEGCNLHNGFNNPQVA